MMTALASTDLSSLIDIPIGSPWKRAKIHKLLGGQRQGGISTPADRPYIILFSSPQGKDYGYKDGWQPDGFYHYRGGPGRRHDLLRGNRAIRDHGVDGKVLLLFNTQKDGRRRFEGPMAYVEHFTEQLPDVKGNLRRGIVFKLAQADISAAISSPAPETAEALGFIASRQGALEASRDVIEAAKTSQERRKRSQRISKYVQERALGYCEMCGFAAPFSRPDSTPYLESHHITQLVDDGPDAPQDMVAACPTCHRRAHHGTDQQTFNHNAHERIKKVEKALGEGRLKVVTAAFIRDKEGQILLAKRKHGRVSMGTEK